MNLSTFKLHVLQQQDEEDLSDFLLSSSCHRKILLLRSIFINIVSSHVINAEKGQQSSVITTRDACHLSAFHQWQKHLKSRWTSTQVSCFQTSWRKINLRTAWPTWQGRPLKPSRISRSQQRPDMKVQTNNLCSQIRPPTTLTMTFWCFGFEPQETPNLHLLQRSFT